ncbi:MAG: elongation factor G [Candidatus Cloacimonetes bacterium]|nr:elongation factor G [Candidatus Cloacimonadota bacterium]MCF7813906.1 elongation factor G [Candidatus Cloacimonadota bacterium]MCF7868503.1 elongation factor G [Candidatus Cloacimonadota bacterium]MCF7884018.1 elongation factor G [Candidatus Cloacimonadota bacterium]
MKNIRNIALVGASGAGKTSLAEQMLFNSKATTRVGKIEDGNTVMDSNAEEIEKGMSMTLGVANLNWKDTKINILDTPGYVDFSGEQIAAATAVENVLFVVNAAAGFEVGLEQSLELLGDRKVTKSIIINRMDNEGADFKKALELIGENTDITPVPIMIPIGREHKFNGVVDIVQGKAFIEGKAAEIPADLADTVEEARMSLMESVAESDDALLEKYFEEGELTDEEMANGIQNAINAGTLVPVFACSATHNIAVNEVMDAIVRYLPAPDQMKLTVLEGDAEKKIALDENGELFAFVFKSFSDPNVGDIAYVRVFSGSMKSGLDVYIPERDSKDRIGTINTVIGKNRKDISELKAGDIGGLVKIKVARGFNSIVKIGSKLRMPEVALPTPVFWQAIKADNQSDEDKIGAALAKFLEEDPTISMSMNAETNENILAGIGEQQIGLIQKRLKSRFKIETNVKTPSVPYRETVKGNADVSYKHKKQSGGKGQFGEVYFRVKPLPRGEGFEFINSVVGGTIPSKFIPAIEKGLNEIMGDGIISGNPIVDISVDVYYGSYHDVDSSEMAFKIATWQCLKKAFKEAKGILLEPVHNVQIIIPDEYMGDVMGDISTRRGKIMGMEQKGKKQTLNAQMPLAELFSYYPALKSLTQGRGKFTQEFSHYEKVPDDIAAKVIEEANKRDE